jgi:hypothetical protein
VPVLAKWVCRTGIRRTAPGFVHDLSVKSEAGAHIDRVEFAIVANGVPQGTQTASSRTIRTPNFSDQPSPDPTVPAGQQKSFDGWGIGLNLSTVPAGTITVTATAFEVGGASYVLPQVMTIYNDTDGGDRRPRTVAPLYVDGDAGNDANNGSSWALAVRTPMRALQLGRSAGGEVGGLRIFCRGTIVNMSGGIFPECTTSGDWWCEWIADASGCYLNPPGDPAPLGPRTLYSGQSGASATTVTCRHRWIGSFRYGRDGCVSYSFGGVVQHWMDGCYEEADNYLGPTRVSVRYAYEGADGVFWGWDGPGPAGERHFSQCDLRGALGGYEVHKFLWDCRCLAFLGIAAKLGSAALQVTSGGLLMQFERYAAREVEGFVRMDNDAAQGKGRPALTVTKPTGTTARITGPVGGYAFNLDALALVGQTYWGLRFAGTGTTNLDTTTAHIVTQVGNDGGAPWVEVTAPSAVAGSIPANTASFWTAQAPGSPAPGREYWYLHPDGYQILRDVFRDAIFDCALVDAPDLQTYFTTGYDLDYFLFDNCRDDGSAKPGMVANWFGTNCTNSILQRCTLTGQFQNTSDASGWAGTIVRDIVFGSLGGDMSTITARGATVTNCHVISGSAFGTNGTSGPWFAGDPTVAPFSVAPSSGNFGTGTAELAVPAVWRYGSSGATRGVLKNVGNLDWSLPASGLVATGTANVPVSATGASSLGVAASSSFTVKPAAVGASSLTLAASGSSITPMLATGAASLQVASSGAAGVPFTAGGTSTLGTVGIIATGLASVPFTALGTSTVAAVPLIVPPPPQQSPRAIAKPPAIQTRPRRWAWRFPWS